MNPIRMAMLASLAAFLMLVMGPVYAAGGDDEAGGVEVVVINEDGDEDVVEGNRIGLEERKNLQREKMEEIRRRNREKREAEMERRAVQWAVAGRNVPSRPKMLDVPLLLEFFVEPEIPGVSSLKVVVGSREYGGGIALGEGEDAFEINVDGSVHEMEGGALIVNYDLRLEMTGEGRNAKSRAKSATRLELGQSKRISTFGEWSLNVRATPAE